MGIKTSIYCGHDFSEEEGRLNLVAQTCKKAQVPVPPEVYERLNAISEGLNRIEVKAELESNGTDTRYRVKTSDIKNTKSDYIYFEFKSFKSAVADGGEPMDLADLELVPPEEGPIKKFFSSKEEGDYEFL